MISKEINSKYMIMIMMINIDAVKWNWVDIMWLLTWYRCNDDEDNVMINIV
jgi:hypothetical protein